MLVICNEKKREKYRSVTFCPWYNKNIACNIILTDKKRHIRNISAKTFAIITHRKNLYLDNLYSINVKTIKWHQNAMVPKRTSVKTCLRRDVKASYRQRQNVLELKCFVAKTSRHQSVGTQTSAPGQSSSHYEPLVVIQSMWCWLKKMKHANTYYTQKCT